MPPDFVVCDYADNLLSFDLMGIWEIIDVYTWLGILLAIMAYMYIYKNMQLGMDLIWPLFCIGCSYNHNRKIVWTYFIGISLIAYTYQSFISSDSMRLSEFLPSKELASKGYRIWIEMGSNIYGGKSTSVDVVFKMLPKSLVNGFAKIFPGYNLRSLLFDGRADLREKLREKDLIAALEVMSDEKLVVPHGLIHALWAGMEHYFMYVQDRFLCKTLSTRDLLPVSVLYTYRMFSYLSKKLSWMQRLWIDSGVFSKGKHFWVLTHWEEFRHYHLERADSFRMPDPMKLKTIMGVACLAQCTFVVCLFIINAAVRVWKLKGCIRGRLRSIRKKFSFIKRSNKVIMVVPICGDLQDQKTTK